jgi:hypothetical protein
MPEDQKPEKLNLGSVSPFQGASGATTAREHQPLDAESSPAKRSSGRVDSGVCKNVSG